MKKNNEKNQNVIISANVDKEYEMCAHYNGCLGLGVCDDECRHCNFEHLKLKRYKGHIAKLKTGVKIGLTLRDVDRWVAASKVVGATKISYDLALDIILDAALVMIDLADDWKKYKKQYYRKERFNVL